VSSCEMGVELPDWMAPDYRVIHTDHTTAVVRSDFLEFFERHRLVDCPLGPAITSPQADDASPGEESGITGGRGGARVVSAGPLGEAVVRPCRRGGWVERVNRRRYFLGDRAFAELVTTHRLRKRGAPVPEPLAAVQSAARPGYVACLVTRRLPRAHSAATVLADASEKRLELVLEGMGRAIRSFHEAGGIHADLNAHNLIVTEDGEGPVFVIDLDRASVAAGPAPARRARRNLKRLERSFRKLQLDEALSGWVVLEHAYAAEPDPPTAA